MGKENNLKRAVLEISPQTVHQQVLTTTQSSVMFTKEIIMGPKPEKLRGER